MPRNIFQGAGEGLGKARHYDVFKLAFRDSKASRAEVWKLPQVVKGTLPARKQQTQSV